MPYLIGGKRPTIIKGTEEEFKKAVLANKNIDLPNISPKRSVGTLNKLGNVPDVTRSAPLFNDPRYTSSTLSIPTDDRTLNGLYRFFAETDPIVGAGLKIQSELPLADLNLGQCEDSGVQQHFEDMWDRINGRKTLQDTVSEHNEIGDVTLFGAFNQSDYMWDQFAILNPDYVKIESTWINSKPLIKLIPDEALKKIVQTQSPRYIYEQLPPDIIRYVLFNQEIPLAPNNTFHIAHAKRPYEARGRSMIKRILKILMLEDRFNQALFALATRHAVPLTVVKLGDPQTGFIPNDDEIDSVRDMFCHSEDTEVLTENGFKNYKDVLESEKIACFDPTNNSLVYDLPTHFHEFDYEGDMIHFNSRCTDILVTPNHKMRVAHRENRIWEDLRADQVTQDHYTRACVDTYTELPVDDKIKIGDIEIPILVWFEFVGWYISEGSLRGKYSGINITQIKKEECKLIENCLNNLQLKWDKYDNNYCINYAPLYRFIENELGRISKDKKIPKWMKNAPKQLLEKFFDAYVLGDGNEVTHKNGTTLIVCNTSSKQLSNDLQEIALKLGYSTRLTFEENPVFRDPKTKIEYKVRPSGKRKGEAYDTAYRIYCSNDNVSKFPGFAWRIKEKIEEFIPKLENIKLPKKGKKYIWKDIDLKYLLDKLGSADAIGKFMNVSGTTIRVQLRKKDIEVHKPGQRNPKYIWEQNDNIQRVPYKGKVWCFTTPTGYFITRRNGRIAIQGNSNWEMDPNFSIFYHYGIDVQFYGSNGKMLPVGPELDRIYKLKFIGLGVHEQLLTGQGGSYSQAYINLEVQRQRYLNLQLKIDQLVHIGWFKPIADLCGFYRVKSAVSGYGGISNRRWGNTQNASHLQNIFSSLRDYKDNQEFKEFIKKKAEENQKLQQSQVREYVYPKLDWGGMSAAADENLKNYVKWLAKERPNLVDDATLARLAKLDRDDQEKATMEDLRRKRDRLTQITKEGLLEFLPKTKGGGGDFGGGLPGDIPVDMGGGLGAEPPLEGGAPDMPIGEGGAPDTAGGDIPPAGVSAKMYKELKHEVLGLRDTDDMITIGENEFLKNSKYQEDYAILKAVNKIVG
jgi:hypothetical protein